MEIMSSPNAVPPETWIKGIEDTGQRLLAVRFLNEVLEALKSRLAILFLFCLFGGAPQLI